MKGVTDEVTLKVVANAGTMEDYIEMRMPVKAKGFPETASSSGFIGKTSAGFIFPLMW